ncbi:adrenocortical dysplasia protein homolog isoform X2 [Dasypus novemcinctus]|uniref:adrenocortical dysplasia protein homolog isoform X2 n=1 Tax=Dasypus novemcinctus TaxID=9361 RepID=UPI00265E8B72|nr:adrenocortical dysplasia protein homolog isoform X2 [Dasypus novemcinctus]
MAGLGSLVLRPWIREMVLGSEAHAGPQAGQLLEVLQEAEAPGPSRAPDASDVGAALLVSDGTHSVRCLVTREALNTSDWEEKEFGFRGAEGRLLLLQDCGVRVQVPEGNAPAEFYLQVGRFSLLPTEQPRVRVAGCNQDPDVQKKLYDCLEEHLSDSASPSEGLSLSQLLDEVQEDKEHRGALVHLAESCLNLTGPCTAPPLTRWAASRCRTVGEVVYTVPSLWLHISENDQQILSSLAPAPELPSPDPALQDLSLTLVSSSSSSPSSSGTPAFSEHVQSEKSSASISLLPALSLAAPDLLQRDSSQPLPAICSAPGPPAPSPPHSNSAPSSPHPSHTPSLLSLGHVLSQHQARVTRAQKPHLEFKELGLPPQNHQSPSRTRTTTGTLESSAIWTLCPLQDPPVRHRDGSAFQYEYEPPCTSLCTQVQAVRLPPQLVAWALHILMEPRPESEQTQNPASECPPWAGQEQSLPSWAGSQLTQKRPQHAAAHS